MTSADGRKVELDICGLILPKCFLTVQYFGIILKSLIWLHSLQVGVNSSKKFKPLIDRLKAEVKNTACSGSSVGFVPEK